MSEKPCTCECRSVSKEKHTRPGFEKNVQPQVGSPVTADLALRHPRLLKPKIRCHEHHGYLHGGPEYRAWLTRSGGLPKLPQFAPSPRSHSWADPSTRAEEDRRGGSWLGGLLYYRQSTHCREAAVPVPLLQPLPSRLDCVCCRSHSTCQRQLCEQD